MHWYQAPLKRGRGRGGLLWLALAGLLVMGSVAVVAFGVHQKAASPTSCGSLFIEAGSDGVLLGGTAGAELCFIRAYRTCTSGMLSYVEHGIDTLVRNDLRVERSTGSCRIIDDVTDDGLGPRISWELVCSGAHWDGSGWLLTGCLKNGQPVPDRVKLWWPHKQGVPGPRSEPASSMLEPSR